MCVSWFFEWEPPFENEKITESDWDRIAKNILAVFDFIKIGVIIHVLEPEEAEKQRREWKKMKEEMAK